MTDCKEMYLDLMKKSLTFQLWDESKLYRPAHIDPHPFYKRWAVNAIVNYLGRSGRQITESLPGQTEARVQGRDWPPLAYTMIGLDRLDNLQACIESVILNEIPGDLIETGVWRGGASIFMRAVLKAHAVADRSVWLADSFQGLPPPDTEKYPVDHGDQLHTYDELRVSLEEVKTHFERYGLLDEQVKFLKGWFSETLPTAPIEKLSVLRLDGDMYESTWDALVSLYPKLSPGGYCIIDDYNLTTCRNAVQDYRSQHGIDEEIRDIDGWGTYWQVRSLQT
ncbi:MAG: TylF/MycF family methyltransferase [Pyrinomonadaceae bacterium]|nr:TylF/MycF family methyltransferase [Pyrinomonadaceae bacterium]